MGKGVECYLFCLKRVVANFFHNMSNSFNFEYVWHFQESFFIFIFIFFKETPLEKFNHISILTSLWSLFGTSKDFENSSLVIFFFFVCYSFWILDYIRIVWWNCRVIDKMCGNWLTCNNHIIKISFMSFICQIPLTLKTCDTITIYKSFL